MPSDDTFEFECLADPLSHLADKTGNKELSTIVKLIFWGAFATEMIITDKVVTLMLTDGAAICKSKVVFSQDGNLKCTEFSVE